MRWTESTDHAGAAGGRRLFSVHLVDVILAFGICGRQYRTARVQFADEPRLGNADGLLFHRFVNTRSVMLSDAVELVDATQATVGKHKSAGLQLPFAAILHTATVTSSSLSHAATVVS